jgi:transcriptional regulator GlxA family with amidase domain
METGEEKENFMTHLISIYIYERMAILDFAGPAEVFITASRLVAQAQPDAPTLFEVITVAEKLQTVTTRGGLIVQPHFTIDAHPMTDVLIIPGGKHDAELLKGDVIDWIAYAAQSARITASVGTGAFLLAKAGLLDGKQATTHWEHMDELQTMFPQVRVLRDRRWVDDGALITAAGLSCGIDMSLHLVARLAGDDLANRTARKLEYYWQPSLA